MLSWTLTMFTNLSSLYFVLRYSAILIISALYAASTCTSPLPPSFLFTYSLSVSAFGCCILYFVSIFLVFLSICFISSILQLIIPQLYLNTGTASAPIAVILFLAFSSDFSIILNLLLYSCFNILSFVDDVRLYFLQFLSTCTFFLF